MPYQEFPKIREWIWHETPSRGSPASAVVPHPRAAASAAANSILMSNAVPRSMMFLPGSFMMRSALDDLLRGLDRLAGQRHQHQSFWRKNAPIRVGCVMVRY
jgi:hypothetical protein